MIDKQQKQEIEQMIIDIVESRATSSKQKRTVDTPTDSYSVVNRRYVTLNGVVASRPRSSVASIGQPYFATDTFIPMTFSIQGWRNGVGSIVSGHR